MTRLWRRTFVPFVLALALPVLLLIAAACGTEEVIPSATPTWAHEATAPTPTASAEAPEGSAGPTPTTVPSSSSPPPIPSDWATYKDPDGRFTLRYPSDWFLQDGGTSKVRQPGQLTTILSSVDPSTGGRLFPSNATKVDVTTDPATNVSGCGALDRAPGTVGSGRAEDFVLAAGAAPAVLGGVSGGQGVSIFDPSREGGLALAHGISVVYKGTCFNIIAYFGEQNPDESVFLQIARSFQFLG